jgi:hypothetical protein
MTVENTQGPKALIVAESLKEVLADPSVVTVPVVLEMMVKAKTLQVSVDPSCVTSFPEFRQTVTTNEEGWDTSAVITGEHLVIPVAYAGLTNPMLLEKNSDNEDHLRNVLQAYMEAVGCAVEHDRSYLRQFFQALGPPENYGAVKIFENILERIMRTVGSAG